MARELDGAALLRELGRRVQEFGVEPLSARYLLSEIDRLLARAATKATAFPPAVEKWLRNVEGGWSNWIRNEDDKAVAAFLRSAATPAASEPLDVEGIRSEVDTALDEWDDGVSDFTDRGLVHGCLQEVQRLLDPHVAGCDAPPVGKLLGYPAAAEPEPALRPFDDWCDEHGAVLWTYWPIVEPPWCGTPLDSDWPFEPDVGEEPAEAEDWSRLFWVPLPAVFRGETR